MQSSMRVFVFAQQLSTMEHPPSYFEETVEIDNSMVCSEQWSILQLAASEYGFLRSAYQGPCVSAHRRDDDTAILGRPPDFVRHVVAMTSFPSSRDSFSC